MTLTQRVKTLQQIFDGFDGKNASNDQREFFVAFEKHFPQLMDDLNFCFEVLAGRQKLGYAPSFCCSDNWKPEFNQMTIKEFYNKKFRTSDLSEEAISEIDAVCCEEIRDFFYKLCNRMYRIGYSGKKAMASSLDPMLAYSYIDPKKGCIAREGFYYIQEKLDGNRCIAWSNAVYGDLNWKFQSRSGKTLNVDFDMSWAPDHLVFDGEIMTLNHAGTRDFAATSGAINSKYGKKTDLAYFIYDIVDDLGLPYKDRLKMLENFKSKIKAPNVFILPVIDKLWIYPNPEYNETLDKYLDDIIDKGGEGLMLRDPDATYKHVRCNDLLKYKKVKTMDLKVIGVEEGAGKYQGMIGALICEDDEHTIRVKVGSGLSDNDRLNLDGRFKPGTIVEVKYFDMSKGKGNERWSLRFPRFKGVRNDKQSTSIF